MINRIFFILLFTITLQGCIFVAGAAAGAAGVAVVYDHRKIENVVQDERIANGIVRALQKDKSLVDTTHVNVTCFNNVVLLTGEATTPELRTQVEKIAQGVPDVGKIYNEISIQGPTSTLTRTSDAWITTKIKTEMLATAGLRSGTIKVVTENGTVFLMGIVTHDQADIAVDIARQVAGVQKVVKIFQYK